MNCGKKYLWDVFVHGQMYKYSNITQIIPLNEIPNKENIMPDIIEHFFEMDLLKSNNGYPFIMKDENPLYSG